MQEASEYLATEQEDGAAFWTLVDSLAPDAQDGKTVESLPLSRQLFDRAGGNSTFDGPALVQVLPAVLEQTRDKALGLHPVSHALLELYLGMGALTPTIELHRTLRKGG